MSQAAIERQIRDQFLHRLTESRLMTDDLFRVVRTEAIYDRPIAQRHRIVFYIGHLEAFDWNLIAGQALGEGAVHPEFDRLFAFGIDPIGGGLPSDQPADWPDLREVGSYVQRVREGLDRLIADTSHTRWQYPQEIIFNTAIEHRLMHAETLAYMFHQLAEDRKIVPADYRPIQSGPLLRREAARVVYIPEGIATLGCPPESPGFGWDNEFQYHTVRVPAFSIHACKVTNGDFLRFIADGGYNEARFWTDGDWDWIQEQGIRHPVFWIREGEQWFYRGMYQRAPLPLDWPVYVSHAEAAAYARYVGGSLPTEAQFQHAAYGSPQGAETAYPWGDAPPDDSRGNFNFHRWDPAPVGSYPRGRSAFGLHDALGNGWEWTSSVFAPFPNFEPFRFYPGYSANFFDGKHYVLKGASPRTAGCMLRRSFRNWFQPHYPFVYASFRCVQN